MYQDVIINSGYVLAITVVNMGGQILDLKMAITKCTYISLLGIITFNLKISHKQFNSQQIRYLSAKKGELVDFSTL